MFLTVTMLAGRLAQKPYHLPYHAELYETCFPREPQGTGNKSCNKNAGPQKIID